MTETKTDYGSAKLRQGTDEYAIKDRKGNAKGYFIRDNAGQDLVQIELRGANEGHAQHARVMTQSWTDKYYFKGQLSERQWQAARKLRSTWERCKYDTMRVSNLLSSGGGFRDPADLAENEGVADARKRWASIMNEMGPALGRVLYWIVCANFSAGEAGKKESLGRTDGIGCLRLALSELADWYDLPKGR